MAKLPLRRIGTDIAGYACLLGAILFGWLPGPGGIPLLLTGLGLLSIYNPWAKRLLNFVRKHSESLRDILFPNTPWVKNAWDILLVFIIISSTFLNIKTDGVIFVGVSIGLYCLSVVIFFFNRNRLRWFQKKRRL